MKNLCEAESESTETNEPPSPLDLYEHTNTNGILVKEMKCDSVITSDTEANRGNGHATESEDYK